MFKQKVIKVTLTLGGKDEAFTASDNQVSYTGLRVSCAINYGNGAPMPTANIRIFGLPMEKINKLIRIKWNIEDPRTGQSLLRDHVRIEAGNINEDLKVAFQGTITFAYPEMGSAPDVALVIESQSAMIPNVKAAPPLAFQEGVKVQDVIELICKDMGYSFENNGVDKIMSETALNGTQLDKITNLCRAHDLDLAIEQGLIAIMNRNEPRKLPVPIISPSTGLIGYPTPTMQGVSFSCLYNPLIRYKGAVIIKDSIIERANSEWFIFGARSILESNTPNGLWQTDVNATYKGRADAPIGR